jgi:hypothetical protein
MMMGGGMLVLLVLLPLLMVALLAIIIVIRSSAHMPIRGDAGAPAQSQRHATFFSSKLCPACYRPMRADWRICPYDGRNLERPATSQNQSKENIEE